MHCRQYTACERGNEQDGVYPCPHPVFGRPVISEARAQHGGRSYESLSFIVVVGMVGRGPPIVAAHSGFFAVRVSLLVKDPKDIPQFTAVPVTPAKQIE